MKAIVCVDADWAIGSGNSLLYHIPADMKFFKQSTVGNVVVMGYSTFMSLPGQKALPDRVNIVLTTKTDFSAPDVLVCHSVEELFELLKKYDTNSVYVCGGAMVYAELLPHCDTAYVTKVSDRKSGADKFFPNLDEKEEWTLVDEGEEAEHKELKYRITSYVNSEFTINN